MQGQGVVKRFGRGLVPVPTVQKSRRGILILKGLRVPGNVFFILTMNSDNVGRVYT